MSENIWRSELIIPYRNPSYSLTSTGIGEWTTRNGENAIRMIPNRFYVSPNYQQIFANEFVPNTRYLFNIWIDTDDHYHNDKYTTAGLMIYYSDGTRDDAIWGAGPNYTSPEPRGWQLRRHISTAGKSIAYIALGYNYNDANYFRWDSYIMPYDESNITKTGQLHTHIAESYDKTSMVKGGGTDTNQIYEY